MKRHQKLKAQAIQKEQFRLNKIEGVLTKLLVQVNESINELKVEELHLKSCLVGHLTRNTRDDQPSTSAQAALRLNTTYVPTNLDPLIIKPSNGTVDMDGIENINKQMLNLESLLVPLNQKNYNEQEEEEEDDSNDTDYDPNDICESDNEELKES